MGPSRKITFANAIGALCTVNANQSQSEGSPLWSETVLHTVLINFQFLKLETFSPQPLIHGPGMKNKRKGRVLGLNIALPSDCVNDLSCIGTPSRVCRPPGRSNMNVSSGCTYHWVTHLACPKPFCVFLHLICTHLSSSTKWPVRECEAQREGVPHEHMKHSSVGTSNPAQYAVNIMVFAQCHERYSERKKYC